MTALLLSVLSALWPYLVAAGAVVGALATAYLKGRGEGVAKEKAKAAKRESAAKDEQLEMHREATEAAREAAALSDEQARKEAMQWARR